MGFERREILLHANEQKGLVNLCGEDGVGEWVGREDQ
jgi:hypothetical protein